MILQNYVEPLKMLIFFLHGKKETRHCHCYNTYNVSYFGKRNLSSVGNLGQLFTK